MLGSGFFQQTFGLHACALSQLFMREQRQMCLGSFELYRVDMDGHTCLIKRIVIQPATNTIDLQEEILHEQPSPKV